MEDPHKILEIPIHEYNSYRANFVARHPDILVVDYKEPHKKFLERLIRDLTVNEVVFPYLLGEIRLRSEDVVQKPGLSPTAEMLLKISQGGGARKRHSRDDAMNRIHALFMVLEYVNVVSMPTRWRLPRLLGRARATEAEHQAFSSFYLQMSTSKGTKMLADSGGCRNKACVFRHVCLACGRDLRWIDRHYKK